MKNRFRFGIVELPICAFCQTAGYLLNFGNTSRPGCEVIISVNNSNNNNNNNNNNNKQYNFCVKNLKK